MNYCNRKTNRAILFLYFQVQLGDCYFEKRKKKSPGCFYVATQPNYKQLIKGLMNVPCTHPSSKVLQPWIVCSPLKRKVAYTMDRWMKKTTIKLTLSVVSKAPCEPVSELQ